MIEEFFNDSLSSSSSESASEVMNTVGDEIVLMAAQWTAAIRTKRKCAGLQMSHLTFHPNRVVDHNLRMSNYFVPGCTYPSYMIYRRFHTSQWLFRRIADDIEANEPFFKQRRNTVGLLGFSIARR